LSIALSTAYVADLASAPEMAAALTNLDIGGVEIDYRLKERDLKALVPILRAANLPITSLHHPVPLPDDYPPALASGDRLSLASPWKDEREASINLARRTLEWASDLEAAAAVFHLGTVADIEPLWAEFRRLYFDKLVDSAEAASWRAEAVERRRELAAPYVDRAMLALERLFQPAERLGVTIALEVRYHFHEVPSPAEMLRIFETFRGAPLGYWHDTGHAEVQERVGFLSHRAQLERFGDHLVGAHLHDIRELTDHLPPGQGTLDFAALADLLAAAPLKVIEAWPAPRRQVAQSIALLREAGIA